MNELEKVMIALEDELEEQGYRMKYNELKAGAEYIIENGYGIKTYVEDTINHCPELVKGIWL